MEALLAAARMNNGDAQYELGLAYLNGGGLGRILSKPTFG
jgi:TPR repeat protein